MTSPAKRLLLGCAALLALASARCSGSRVAATPAVTAAPSPAPVTAALAEPAPESAPPSEHPAGFDADVTEQDVDGDGLLDRVRAIPAVERPGAQPFTFMGLPPAIVAHRLPDGRYAVDDDLTRAALRAL